MKKIFFALIVSVFVLVGCSGTGNNSSYDFSDGEKMQIAHCQFMDMKECREYDNLPQDVIDEAYTYSCTLMPGMPDCEKEDQGNSQEPENHSVSSITDIPMMGTQERIDLNDGDTYEMVVDEATKELNGKKKRLYAYNGSIPGPYIRVKQGSSIRVNVINQLDDELTTVHWHGLRHSPEHDGVPLSMGGSQQPIAQGDAFTYELDFPDVGMMWYHPHVKEDKQQDLGLYGNILVIPNDSEFADYDNYYPLILDDIRLDDAGDVIPYAEGEAVNHALMGRYGNHFLFNGEETPPTFDVDGNVARILVTNVSNARPYRLEIPEAILRIIGSDLGEYDVVREVEEVIIAPAERYTLEIAFPESGNFRLVNNAQDSTVVANFEVKGETTNQTFADLKAELPEEAFLTGWRQSEPNKTLDLTMMIEGLDLDHSLMGEHQGTIEWDDLMYDMNKASTSETVTWKMVDTQTGKENMMIDDWKFVGGEWVKVRLTNNPDSAHPMQHPIHFHGQRFIVLSENGNEPEGVVWKDTVLVPMGEYTDILLDMSNPGTWMAHCHISEHMGSGMMMNFTVEGSEVNNEPEEASGLGDTQTLSVPEIINGSEILSTETPADPMNVHMCLMGGGNNCDAVLNPANANTFETVIQEECTNMPGMEACDIYFADLAYLRSEQENTDFRVVNVTATQFNYEPSYIEASVGEKVKLFINNADVTHGIAIPGMTIYDDNEVTLDTSKPGTFEFVCVNYCGSGHKDMSGTIVIK